MVNDNIEIFKTRILIVEDEEIIAVLLKKNLENEGFKVVGIVDNGREALAVLREELVDLVLLDINIKGDWDGIETAVQFKIHKNLPIIYITALADDATFERAKATLPSAYLTKPFQIIDVRKAIDLALYHFSKQQKHLIYEHGKTRRKKELVEMEGILQFNNAIFLKQNYRYTKIAYQSILYLKADGNHTYIQTIEKKHIVKNSLQNVIEIFNAEKFIRVHRSYAINMNHLTSFNESTLFVGVEEIPIGRNYKDAFLQLFERS